MRSRFAIEGHPIHPMLVPLAIGLFVWAFLADIIYLATEKDQTWYDISFWTGIGAILMGLIAAVPGFADYFSMAVYSKARAISTAHMVLNLTTVGTFVAAAILMVDNSATEGQRLTAVLALHTAGVTTLAISGWLGGEMVFRHHLGVIADSRELEDAEYDCHKVKAER
jgi:uncharacterized membrane protein